LNVLLVTKAVLCLGTSFAVAAGADDESVRSMTMLMASSKGRTIFHLPPIVVGTYCGTVNNLEGVLLLASIVTAVVLDHHGDSDVMRDASLFLNGGR
jgi:hypothetical protein